ncbi:MAG TPA: hypothetical protein VFP98_02435 [Candidatus Polarisedimenticolia bacterium]|nr:hypothetical protein [Candidatus Polarisedimenticolia bacterium]
MPQQDEVYTIEEDVLESMRRQLDRRRPSRRNGPSTGESKIRYAQPPPRGSNALMASTLSLFFWGAGQIYNGQGKLGVLMLLVQSLAVALHWSVMQIWPSLRDLLGLFGVTEWQMMQGVLALEFSLVIVALTCVHQAYRRAEVEAGHFEGYANPFASGLASFVLPGWGQLVNGQVGKAMMFLTGLMSAIYIAAIMMFTPFLRLLATVDPQGVLAGKIQTASVGALVAAGMMWILSVYDAVLVAGYRRSMS